MIRGKPHAYGLDLPPKKTRIVCGKATYVWRYSAMRNQSLSPLPNENASFHTFNFYVRTILPRTDVHQEKLRGCLAEPGHECLELIGRAYAFFPEHVHQTSLVEVNCHPKGEPTEYLDFLLG